MNQRLHQEFQSSKTDPVTEQVYDLKKETNQFGKVEPEQDSGQKQRVLILDQIKQEVSSLLTLGQQIDESEPLIYEEEHVVEHLERIDEFFDTLEDDLTEVRNYMVALLEFVEENESDDIRKMIPLLSKIIDLMAKVLPEGTPSATPVGFGDISASEINPRSERHKETSEEAEEPASKRASI